MYSTHCNRCGDTFISESSEAVAKYRRDHAKLKVNQQGLKITCPMIRTPEHTLMRPSLVLHILQHGE